MLDGKSQTQKSTYCKILFMQNSGERKLSYSDRKEISGSMGLGAEGKMGCKHV